MATLNGHFTLLKKRIEPDPARAVKAGEFAEKVRQHLQNHAFETESPHTRLSGSYARLTAIKNIKDVDIVVFVGQSWRQKTIKELMDELHAALSDLPETLGEGTVLELRRQRRSINVDLPDSDMSLDIVPVLKTSSDHRDVLEIPDREWDDWVFTHPLGYGSLLSEVNKDNGGKVVPHIKLMKHWRDVKFGRMAPKSYWLESAVVQHIRKEWVLTEGQADDEIFADLLDSIYGTFKKVQDSNDEDTPFIPDAKWRNPVAWNWKRSWFNSFMTRLDDSRGKARKAVDTLRSSTGSEAENKEKAVELWKQVFGDEWFPSTSEVEEENRKAREANQPLKTSERTVSVATGLEAGRVYVEKPPEIKTITASRNRYYGD